MYSLEYTLKHIFGRYAKHLCLYARNYLPTDADAEDVVQDVFIRCWEKKQLILSDEKVVKTYLFNAVKNACLDKLEKKGPVYTPLDTLKQEILDEETVLFDEKIVDEIKQELEQMPRQTRKIISLIFMQDMKYRADADEMHISVNTVKTLLRNGIKHLRNRFAGHLLVLYLYLKFKPTCPVQFRWHPSRNEHNWR